MDRMRRQHLSQSSSTILISLPSFSPSLPPSGLDLATPVTLTEWVEGFYSDATAGQGWREGVVEAVCEEGEIMFVPRGEEIDGGKENRKESGRNGIEDRGTTKKVLKEKKRTSETSPNE